MKETLQQQYGLLKGSRTIVFDFIEKEIGEDFNISLPAYADQSIRNLLEHTASCYFHWLAYFALKKPEGSINEQGFVTVGMIRQLYEQVDQTMSTFLETFDGKMDVPITALHSAVGIITATPLQLFTHVVTHEFHHKGQIMLMCRLLGHVPTDTDVSRFFEGNT